MNPLEVIFSNVSEITGFGIDQSKHHFKALFISLIHIAFILVILFYVRYLMMFVVSYPLAIILRSLFPPGRTSVTIRCFYCLFFGLFISLVCFGWKQSSILFCIVAISYILLLVLPPSIVQRYSMIWAMACISTCHIYRMITDYGGYHLDFTGPLMVMVQRISYVGYAVHDGMACRHDDLNKDQKTHKIESVPPLLHYLAYTFSFNSLLAGPSCTYREYMAFIDGSNFNTSESSAADMIILPFQKHERNEPSVLAPTVKKLLGALLFLVLYVILCKQISNETVLEPHFNQPFRLVINFINSFRVRCGFYFIWLISESICNCSGLGFVGYDENGTPIWNLVSNLKILDIEFGTSIRTIVNGWNALTSQWLRRCVYERTTLVNPTLMTFVTSAVWHGFYPGYFFNFIYFAITLMAARKMRSLLHAHFQEGPVVKRGYDVSTWLLSILFRETGVLCQELMFLDRCMLYWRYYYYIPPLLSLVVAFMPFGNKSSRKKKSENGTKKTE